MAGKLQRNTSDAESRAWWEAVEKAAASAVDLEFEEGEEEESARRRSERRRTETPG